MKYFTLGPWSDRHGRKIPLLIGHFGVLISMITYLVLFYVKTIPSEYALLASVATGITGSFMNLAANTSGYICDISSEKSRTFRLTLLYSMARLGTVVGNFLGGIIVVHWNYGVLFAAWTIVGAVSLAYGIFGIENVKPVQKIMTEESDKKDNFNAVLKRLNLDKFIISFSVTMKKRKGYTRGKILALCTAMCTPIIAVMGK